MLVVSGTLLVLFTWLAALAVVVSVGLLPALALTGSRRLVDRSTALRRSLWWGLLITILGTLLVNQFLPLHHPGAALLIGVLVLGLGIPGWWLLLRCTCHSSAPTGNWSRRLLVVALLGAIVYVAVAALGPVTNYDTGLYHLGAVRYAAEFPAVPGIANLYFPFGYATAQFPLAAVLGNGPWQFEGLRLVNGFILVMAVADLWWRSRSARLGSGFFVLLVGTLAMVIPLVALSDYWVTSPTQDASALILTVVLSAYFAQSVAGGRRWANEAATASVLAITVVLVRPTMIVYAVSVIGVLIVLAWRRRIHPVPRTHVVLTAALAIAAIVVVTLRDRVLSGWLQFPLSVYGFDVPWRTPDPMWNRMATLGYHRNAQDLWGSVDGWAWVGPWTTELTGQWETYAIAGLLLVAVGISWVALRRLGPALRLRALAAVILPSVLGAFFWFAFTPPAYRFAWGILFSLGTIPLGWSLWRLSRARPAFWINLSLVAVAIPIIGVSVVSALYRLDVQSMTAQRDWRIGLISFPYAVAPMPAADVRAFTTDSGLTLLQPTESDQCWTVYPLCTPEPSARLRLGGSGIESGFLP